MWPGPGKLRFRGWSGPPRHGANVDMRRAAHVSRAHWEAPWPAATGQPVLELGLHPLNRAVEAQPRKAGGDVRPVLRGCGI